MTFRLADHGSVFSTRPMGAGLRKILLGSRDVGEEIEVSFEGVQSVSHSFADEFLGPLILSSDEVRITGASPAVDRIIQGVLRRRARMAKQRTPRSASA